MKANKILFFGSLFLCIPFINFGQGLVNNGGKIIISSGAYLNMDGSTMDLVNQTSGSDGTVSNAGSIYLQGDFNNQASGAILDLTAGATVTGTVYFDGTSTQQITHGTYRTKFYDVNIIASAIVEVPAQKEVEISHDLYNGGTFTLKSTTDGTGSLFYNGLCQEDIKVERYIKYDGTGAPIHYLSSPVNDAEFTDIWTAGDYNAYWYDETNTSTNLDQGWTRMSSGTLVDAKGYVIPYAAVRTLTFTGDIANSKSIGIDITYNSSSTTTADGWNLIGNPYPSSISASSFLNDNDSIVGCVYFWDDGNGTINRGNDYASWNETGPTATAADDAGNMGDPNGTIAIGQGFFVQALNTISSSPSTNYVYFRNSQKTSNISNQFFVPDPFEGSRMWLGINNPESAYNEILLGFMPEATTGNDRLYDAPKLKGNPNIAFYSLLEGKDYAIQGLPVLSTDQVDINLGFDAGVAGTHEIFLKNSENMEMASSIQLEDMYAAKIIDLKQFPNYSFTSDIGTFKDRFVVHINGTQTSMAENRDILQPDVYLRGSNMIVNSKGIEFTSMQIYAVGGKLIEEVKGKRVKGLSYDCSNLKGNYIIRLTGNQSSYTKLLTVL
ncbi:MAG: hypothetical protein HN691_18575 [Bacteroidetes bacterium]|jgi:hypothetical protein|nr:hypothetical protein [Bacteroidota bacterium]